MPMRGMEEIFGEFRDGYAELFPEPLTQCAVVLRAAEEVAQEFAKRCAATRELDHARGDFEVRDKLGSQARGIAFWLAVNDRLGEQIAGSKRVKQSFARDGIDARSRVPREGPIPANDLAMTQCSQFRRRKHVTVKSRAVRGDFFFANEIVEKLAQF